MSAIADTNTLSTLPSPRLSFSSSRVNRVVRSLSADGHSKSDVQRRWLRAVASRVVNARGDLESSLLDVLGIEPDDENPLEGLSIGEIGICYEALLALVDRKDRKASGQFFTPDDAARFMAQQSLSFGSGTWLDPCCGVGNLAWHLADVQASPDEFVRDSLVLIDRDSVALQSAVALIAAEFAAADSNDTVNALASKSTRRDFLSVAALPPHDFAILNPPYARASAPARFETAKTSDSFAFFFEKIAKSARGFISVTPAAYLAAPKYQSLRDVLDREVPGGEVFVFDNVPDTLFRGYKYGSHNTSKTNFVRAAVSVCAPAAESWRITPIIRWQAADRSRMFEQCSTLLGPRQIGPHGEWVKLGPRMDHVWKTLRSAPRVLSDLVSSEVTPYRLDVGLTPRYYISAAFRALDRGSKATLYFNDSRDRDHAAIVLNSSIPYIWWRALDGGVTLPRRVLMSVPMPELSDADLELITLIKQSELENIVVKHNAGRDNENVKHPETVVKRLNAAALHGEFDLRLLYASSMFPPTDVVEQRPEGDATRS